MRKCEFGREDTCNETRGCQTEGRYVLMYSVDWGILESGNAALSLFEDYSDMHKYSCKAHLKNMSFVFDVSHGLPEIIYDLHKGMERPDLVKRIKEDYEK